MKESEFINKNSSYWQELESIVIKKKKKDKDLYELYVKSISDLSFAQTFYKNRTVRVYLNSLSQGIFFKIYKSISVEKWKNFKLFWKEDLPATIWQCRKSLLLSLILFLLSFGIGLISTQSDKNFANLILGNDYIATTLDNIKKGDPLAIYKSNTVGEMTTHIIFNNIYVAILTFISGIVWGVGTVFLLLYNGIMLGTFEMFLYQQGVLKDSLFIVWLHGTIEILSIVIAGGAGFELAKGVLFPGTYRRLESLRRSSIMSIKIMIGIIPLFIIAGFIEGYITRHTEVNWIIRLILILVSLFFMLFYFVFLPYKMRNKKTQETEVKFSMSYEIVYFKIKTGFTLFYESIIIFVKNLKVILTLSSIAALCWMLFSFDKNIELYDYSTFTTSKYLKQIPSFFFALFLSILLFIYNQSITLKPLHNSSYKLVYLALASVVPIAIVLLLLSIPGASLFFILAVYISYWLLKLYNVFDKSSENITPPFYPKAGFANGLGGFLILQVTYICFAFVIENKIWEDLISRIISIHLTSIDASLQYYLDFIKGFLLSIVMFVFLHLFFIMSNLYFGTLIEITNSIDLKTRLNKWLY